MYNVEYFINLVKEKSDVQKQVLVVACPYDDGSIKATCRAVGMDLVDAIFVGERGKIEKAIEEASVEHFEYSIVDADSLEDSALKTVELLASGRGTTVMKGMIDTSILLKAILKKEYGLRTDRQLSHVSIMFKPNSDKYFLITDAGINIEPGVEEKKQIVQNAVELAHALGNPNPKVAMLCAKEKVYDKMPATIHAQELHEMNKREELKGCVVSGPLQIDNAVSKMAASIKGVTDPVAGEADILVVPSVDAGNILGKGLKYLADYQLAGVVMGPKVPMAMVSRADGEDEKIMSIALTCALVANKKNGGKA